MPAPLSPQHLALGNAIRHLRQHQGISQERLAQIAGVHRNYVGAVERGERNIAYTNLTRIAAALNVRASELVARAETQP